MTQKEERANTSNDNDERWQPTPVPLGDGRHDIGDDVRAAIVRRLTEDWDSVSDLPPAKVRQLAMWAGASIRALLHELGTLRDLSQPPSTNQQARDALQAAYDELWKADPRPTLLLVQIVNAIAALAADQKGRGHD